MVLKFSNEILWALTGERGIFDTKIAFAGKQGNSFDIYTLGFDGSGLARLTDLKTLSILPRWSPDGKEYRLHRLSARQSGSLPDRSGRGREKKISSSRGLNLAGSWASDGKSLLVTSSKDGKEEIYLMDLADYRMSAD